MNATNISKGLFSFVLVLVFSCGFGIQAAQAMRIALILPSTIEDMSWSQAMYTGVKSLVAKNPQLQLDITENLGNPAEVDMAVRQYALQGVEIIIAHGTHYLDLLEDIAPHFPKTTFVHDNATLSRQPNIIAYEPKAEEGAYLLGMVAGLMSKSQIVGIIGPMETGDDMKFNRGFSQGAKAVRPEITVRMVYTGSYDDLVGAGEIARTQIKAGADFLAGSSQQAMGAIKAASEYPQVRWMSSDLNPKALAPNTVLGAQVYDFAKVVQDIIDFRKQGILGGKVIPISLANGYEFVEYNAPIPEAIMTQVRAAQAQIIAGTLKIDTSK